MLLKQASKRLFFLPSSAISTLLKRERGTSQPLVLGALPPALGSWAPTSGAEVPRRDGALVCREPCQKVPPPSMTWPSPEDHPDRQSLPPLAFRSSPDVARACRTPLLSPASLHELRAGQSTAPLTVPLDSPWMADALSQAQGHGLCRGASQARGWARTIQAMASMACCRTATYSRCVAFSSTSACRAQPGWCLAAASTQCQQTQHQVTGLEETLCLQASTSPQSGPAARFD